jgi:hypothetical protein
MLLFDAGLLIVLIDELAIETRGPVLTIRLSGSTYWRVGLIAEWGWW